MCIVVVHSDEHLSFSVPSFFPVDFLDSPIWKLCWDGLFLEGFFCCSLAFSRLLPAVVRVTHVCSISWAMVISPLYGLTCLINLWMGNIGSLLYTRKNGDSPIEVWGQHLYAINIWPGAWSQSVMSSWHRFLIGTFRNLLKFSVLPLDWGM